MPIDWMKCDPDTLDPVFRKDVEEFLAASPYTWGVCYAFRSIALQKELYDKHLAGGPRAAPPGRSAHNFGLAVDVVLDGDPAKPGVQMDWVTTHAGWLWLKAKSIAHPRLRTGWKYADYGHIEAVNWQTMAKAKGY